MKKQILLIASCAALGASTFAIATSVNMLGGQQIETKAAYSATSKTIYLGLKNDAEGWKTKYDEGKQIVAKYWKTGETDGHSVCTFLNDVSIDATKYMFSCEIPDDVSGFLFCVYDGEYYWDQSFQTVNLTIQANDNNFYALYSDLNNGQRTGYWKEYHAELNGNFYLRGAWANGWSIAGQKKMDFVVEDKYSYTGLFNFTDNNVSDVKAVKYVEGEPKYYNCTSLTVNGGEQGPGGNANAWVGVNNQKATVTVSGGTYTVVNDNSAGAVDANGFATAFTDVMHESCPYSSTHDDYSAVETQWTTLSGVYSGLSTDTKDLLKATTGQSDEVTAFQVMYRMVYANASGVRSNDFANVPNLPSFGLNYVVNQTSDNVASWSIAALAIAGLVVAGGAFFLRKKKEQQ